MALLFHFKRT